MVMDWEWDKKQEKERGGMNFMCLAFGLGMIIFSLYNYLIDL